MKIRKTSRVILFNSTAEVLLQRVIPLEPLRSKQSLVWVWIAPGGQIEDNESIHECAARELYEETGISDCEFGTILWHGIHILNLSGEDTVFDEHFVFAKVHGCHIPSSGDNIGILEQKWWKIEDLVDNKVPTFPVKLPELLISMQNKSHIRNLIDINFY